MESKTISSHRQREQDLAGKVAIITGASRGIGRSIAWHLAARGCSILGTCSSADTLHLIDDLAHEVADLYAQDVPASRSSTPTVVGLAANILEHQSAKAVAAKLTKLGGHVDIFVNNAAYVGAETIGEINAAEIERYLQGNMHFPVAMVDELVKHKHFRSNSRIVYISSVRARKALAQQSLYMATKSAGESLCRAWSDAFGGKYPRYDFMAGTTANSVMVGITRTDAVYSMPEDAIKNFESEFVPHQSVPRVGEPQDIAGVVGLLCREEARWITGSVVAADGGGVKIL